MKFAVRLLTRLQVANCPPAVPCPQSVNDARLPVGRPDLMGWEAMQSLETMRLVSIRHGERDAGSTATPRSIMLAQMHQSTRQLCYLA